MEQSLENGNRIEKSIKEIKSKLKERNKGKPEKKVDAVKGSPQNKKLALTAVSNAINNFVSCFKLVLYIDSHSQSTPLIEYIT